MKHIKLVSIMLLAAIILTLSGCALAAPTPAPPTFYEVGEMAESAGIQIVLNEYKMVDKQVHLNFTVTNNSPHEFNVSTRYSMEAFNTEGNKMVFMMCPENELGGRLAIGESMTGFVCLSGADSPAGVVVNYDPTHQMAYSIAWELK